MNDLITVIIIIILVIMLFIAYILLSYFYNSYTTYKENVDKNFSETKTYINDTNKLLNNNIIQSYELNNKNIVTVDSNNSQRILTLTNQINSNINIVSYNANSNLSNAIFPINNSNITNSNNFYSLSNNLYITSNLHKNRLDNNDINFGTINTNIASLNTSSIKNTQDITAILKDVDIAKTNIDTANTNIDTVSKKLDLGLAENKTTITTNLNSFDAGIKQFMKFNNVTPTGNVAISDRLYQYTFGTAPNLSFDLIRNVTALSGMTVNTQIANNQNFRVCDNANTNCVDLNINANTFDISPSPTTGNAVKNIVISNAEKTKKLTKFDTTTGEIYLGSDDNNAAMYVKNNDVYLKHINFIEQGTNYNSLKTVYDKSNPGKAQTFNTYKFDFNDVTRGTLLQYNVIYTISSTSLIMNIKTSIDVPEDYGIKITIPEINYMNALTLNFTLDPSIVDTTKVKNIYQKDNVFYIIAKAFKALENIRIKLSRPSGSTTITIPSDLNGDLPITNIINNFDNFVQAPTS